MRDGSTTRANDSGRVAREALEELLRAIDLHAHTGPAYLRLDCNQGGVTAARTGRWTEELFRPQR